MTHTGPTPTRRRLMSALRVIILISFGLLAIWIGTRPQRAQAQRATNMAGHASFGADGSLHLPLGYRQWQHVGTRIKPDGKSVLDGSDISTPQVMDAYVEPAAFEQFKKTGTWRDGTRIVKEISLVKTGARCNSVTFVCATSFGTGIFEASYAGIGMMVKDTKRFPDVPGHWGYFSFLRGADGYQATASVRPHEQCAACHEKLAAASDYVFSDSHIGLLSGN